MSDNTTRVELSIRDRFQVLSLLKTMTGSLATLRIVRDGLEQLSFTEGELEEFNIIDHGDGRLSWDPGAPAIAFDLSNTLRKQLLKKLNDLSGRESLDLAALELYELFSDEEE